MKEKYLSPRGAMARVKPLLFGTVFGLIISVICLVLLAWILSSGDFSAAFATSMSAVAGALGALVGGFIAARMFGKQGLIMGAATGLVLYLLLLVAALLIAPGEMTLMSLMRLVIMLLASGIGGIIGVSFHKSGARKFR